MEAYPGDDLGKSGVYMWAWGEQESASVGEWTPNRDHARTDCAIRQHSGGRIMLTWLVVHPNGNSSSVLFAKQHLIARPVYLAAIT